MAMRAATEDTEAKEVPDFYTYYNSSVAGGTRVASAYQLVNRIVEEENLERDYNIYVFHGTDGDDWDKSGKEAVPAIRKMFSYANRIGRPGGDAKSTRSREHPACPRTTRSQSREPYRPEVL